MYKNSFVIGLSGQARAGKDTVAKLFMHFANMYRIPATQVAFANALKKMYHHAVLIRYLEANQMSSSDYSMTAYKEISRFLSVIPAEQTQNETLQWLLNMPGITPQIVTKGYDPADEEGKSLHRRNLIDIGMYLRSIDPDFWVKAAFTAVPDNYSFVITSDMRFENEAAFSDLIVRVVRPGLDIIYKDGAIDTSEVYAFTGKFDRLVTNNGDYVHIAQQVKDIFEECIVLSAAATIGASSK